MIEKIGKVQLDLSKYSGEDLYTDGAVEDELLEIVQSTREEDFPRLIGEKRKWPLLYHLSPLRENIVDWLPISDQDKILEVGSGCGAITGALARKAGEVTCVDLSRKRSRINAYRHRECGNVTIHVGNFKDVEPELPCDYDMICLIGVFEYGQGYIGGTTPYEDFLKILMKHLKKNGRLIIAIENQFGLKYFAGCAEDHTGGYFSGIEGYGEGGNARTFGRKGLERIFRACGVPEWHFYYPYPDYKFMTALYSDMRLPGKGELSNNLRNFDRDRMLLFDEKKAFDEILKEGLFPVFSNSYLAVLGAGYPVEFVKYSNDRAGRFAVKTRIDAGKADPGERNDFGTEQKNGEKFPGGEKAVWKLPLTEEAANHVAGIYSSYRKLCERYKGGNLCINNCAPLDDRDAGRGICLEYVDGIPLSEIMDSCLEQGDVEGFYRWFHEFLERTGYHEEYSVADFDLVFSNILVSGDKWTLIDYEWTFDRSISSRKLAYRAAYCYMLENEKRRILDEERLIRELGLTKEEAGECREQEWDFQSYVNGGISSMAQLRDYMDKGVIVPQDWMNRNLEEARACRVQIYEDRGTGFTEADSYFVPDACWDENLVNMELTVKGDVKTLRIDPLRDSCMVYLKEMFWNGKKVNLRGWGLFSSNGSMKKMRNRETGEPMLGFVFPTTDPNILFRIRPSGSSTENRLSVKMEVVRLPAGVAHEMAETGTFQKGRLS